MRGGHVIMRALGEITRLPFSPAQVPCSQLLTTVYESESAAVC